MDDERQARSKLVAAYRRVADLRLNEMSSGNLSVRFGSGMLISPTGASSETISEENLVFIDAEGEWAVGRNPSTEWRMHSAIYRESPTTHAIVHTHSDYCVAVSCQGRPLPGFHYLVGLFGGDDVPCVPYFTFGTTELGEAAALALKERRACLLANHGMISHAETLGAAVGFAQRLEIMCRQYVLARQIGEPKLLSATDWENFFKKLEEVRYRN